MAGETSAAGAAAAGAAAGSVAGPLGMAVGALGGLGSSLLGISAGGSAAKDQYRRQVRMMKHAHQWEVEDLRAAGLNPILSAGGSGAHGMAQMAPMYNVSDIGESALKGAATALSLNRAKAEIDLIQAQAENVRSKTGIMEPTEQMMQMLSGVFDKLMAIFSARDARSVLPAVGDEASRVTGKALANKLYWDARGGNSAANMEAVNDFSRFRDEMLRNRNKYFGPRSHTGRKK